MRIQIAYLILLASWCVSFNGYAQKNRFEAALKCHAPAGQPGIVAKIEHQGETVFTGAHGIGNIKTNRPLSPNDQFQIGSATKQFTAAAILRLTEQGKLSLQDKLTTFIPSKRKDRKHITVLSLLNHTSGLEDYFDKSRITRRWHKYAETKDIITALDKISSQSTPGEAYSYSNVGYVLLGRIIEIASGKSYSQYLQTEFFTPLNMIDTFVMEQGDKLDVVQGYTFDGDELTTPETVDRIWIYAAGAIVSTLDDLSRWHDALISGKIVNAQNYKRMTTKNLLNNGEAFNYGLGLDVYPIAGLNSYSHQGMVPGFMAWTVYFPEQQLFATALSNNDRRHPGPALLNMIAIHLGLSPDPVSQDDILEAEKLVGKYEFEDGDRLEIFKQGSLFFAKSKDFDKRLIIPRKKQSFSWECTEDYYQLRKTDGQTKLYPVSLYGGEGKPANKL